MITYFFIILKCSVVRPIEIQIIHNIFSCRQIHYIYLEWSTFASAVARTRHSILLTFFNAITLNEQWNFVETWRDYKTEPRLHGFHVSFLSLRCLFKYLLKFHIIRAMLTICTWNKCLSLMAIMTSTLETMKTIFKIKFTIYNIY